MSDEVAVTMLGRDVPGPSLLDWSHFVMAHWPGIIMCVSWHVLYDPLHAWWRRFWERENKQPRRWCDLNFR